MSHILPFLACSLSPLLTIASHSSPPLDSHLSPLSHLAQLRLSPLSSCLLPLASCLLPPAASRLSLPVACHFRISPLASTLAAPRWFLLRPVHLKPETLQGQIQKHKESEHKTGTPPHTLSPLAS